MGIIDKIKEIIENVKQEGEVLKGEKSKDTYYSTKKSFNSVEEAIQKLEAAKARLFDVNGWSKIPAIANSTFALYDANGFPLTTKFPEVGQFAKIKLPGPLPENWVTIVDIKNEENMAEFTVRPSHDPTKSNIGKTEHFFEDKATSTFRVWRNGLEIEAAEIGKNEAINNHNEEAGDRKVINTAIAEGGWAGFQKYQWQNLTDFLVEA